MTDSAAVLCTVRYAIAPDQPDGLPRRAVHPATFDWRADRPHEVLLHFPDMTWVFGWELLAAGIDRPAGIGDIVIRPAGDCLEMVFRPPSGRKTRQFPAADVDVFVAAVAAVWEPVEFDDAELAAWIARAES